MKLAWNIKCSLDFYLKQFEKKNGCKTVIEILKIILDENKSFADASIEIPRLQELAFGLRAGSQDASQQKLDALDATWLLARCFQDGLGVAKDFNRAAELYQQAAKQGHAESEVNFGSCCLRGQGVSQNTALAIEIFQKRAAEGLATAQCNLGFCYEFGHGGIKDSNAAAKLYQLAAAQGASNAQYSLGDCYQKGVGVDKNSKLSIEFYLQAASQGHTKAIEALAFCYSDGQGVIRDLKRAAEYLEAAAKHRLDTALLILGIRYETGLGVTADMKHALVLYHQAAELGYARAMFLLANYYSQGQEINKSLKHTIILIRAAAAKGFEEAIKKLAELNPLLAKGQHLFPTLEQAITFYSKAKDFAMLGFCYQFGLGVAQDIKEAIKNYDLAIQQGVPCFWNLLSCLCNLGPELPRERFTEFYKEIEKYSSSGMSDINLEALNVLAYLSERGAPYFDQDLYRALKSYQKLTASIPESKEKSEQSAILKLKNEQYAFLPTFKGHVLDAIKDKTITTDVYDKAILPLIAEYAFELGNPKKP